jgi:flavin reductase (DIM6/NTAB) family NADH-FMN oxidoreductase RutF
MPLANKIHIQLRKALLGPTDLPLNMDVPVHFPQTEVSVWLHGAREPRDVTASHSVACISPFLFCIGLESNELAYSDRTSGKRFSLKFCRNTPGFENIPGREVLAEIGLEYTGTLRSTGRFLSLFRAVSCRNSFLPPPRSWAHDLFNVYGNWRSRKSTGQNVSALEMRCNSAAFICPRQVVLVSVLDQDGGNIFPMNLLGALGGGHFGFALNSARQAAPLAGRIRRLALSSIPYRHIAVARDLRRNHRQASIRWEDLPFPVRKSRTFQIPVPEFALRVCELNIEDSWSLGSHTFFLAHIVDEEILSDDSAFYMIHGQYAALRHNTSVAIPLPAL